MRTISKDELTEILRKHEMWIYGEVGGIRADGVYYGYFFSGVIK